MYCINRKASKILQIFITVCLISEDMIFMAAKINLNQYVIFITLQNFDTADIKCLTVGVFIFITFRYYLVDNVMS